MSLPRHGLLSALFILVFGANLLHAQTQDNPRFGIITPFFEANHAIAAQDLGAGSSRFTLYWNLANPSFGVYDWSSLDQHLDVAIGQLGMQVLITVGELTPAWAGPCPTCSPYDWAYYEIFFEEAIRRATTRYPGGRMVFGVWNEPNLGAFFQDNRQADNYGEMFRRADIARDRVGPNIRIAGPETSWHAWHDGYLLAAMNKIRPYLQTNDVVTVHWYPDSPLPISQYMNDMKLQAHPYNAWLTEVGHDTCNDSTQANTLANTLNAMNSQMGAGYWEKTFVYHMRTGGTCSFTLINPNWTRRNSFNWLANYYNTHPSTGIANGGRVFRADEALLSPDKRFKLIYQSDGNLVLYRWDGVPLWHTFTNNTDSGYMTMQHDGNLVVYDRWGTPVWHAGTFGNNGAYLKMQNDGNLVIYSSGNVPLWWSGTCCY